MRLIESDVNIRFVVGSCFVEEGNGDITVVELLDKFDAAISLTEDDEANVVLHRDIDVALVVEDVDVDEVAGWRLVLDL